jgi:hypothetical protein
VLNEDDERMPVARADLVPKNTEARVKKEIPTNLSFTVAVSYANMLAIISSMQANLAARGSLPAIY